MRDFTLTTYKKILTEFLQAGYRFVTFAEYVETKPGDEKLIILRHDVDKKPMRSLRTAMLENELGIRGTYYFRIVKNGLPYEVIERVSKFGHEIGYHYDDLNAASGVVENALDSFGKNLAKLRELVPVKTACMHGSPLSKHDNREIWKSYNYHEFGIIGEPYFDIDYGKVLYLTDTGRRWDGERVNIRDRVGSSQKSVVNSLRRETANKLTLHSTMDIINALKNDGLPGKIMLTMHPQRWMDEWLPWMGEWILQNVKNVVKYFFVRDNM